MSDPEAATLQPAIPPEVTDVWQGLFSCAYESTALRISGIVLSAGGLIAGGNVLAHASPVRGVAVESTTGHAGSISPKQIMNHIRRAYANKYEPNLTSNTVIALKEATLTGSTLALNGRCHGSNDYRFKSIVDMGTFTKAKDCDGPPLRNFKHTKDTYNNLLDNIGEKVTGSINMKKTQYGSTRHIMATAAKAEVIYNRPESVIVGDKQLKEVILHSGKNPVEKYYTQSTS